MDAATSPPTPTSSCEYPARTWSRTGWRTTSARSSPGTAGGRSTSCGTRTARSSRGGWPAWSTGCSAMTSPAARCVSRGPRIPRKRAATRPASCCYQALADYRGEFGVENRVKVPTIFCGKPLLAVITWNRRRSRRRANRTHGRALVDGAEGAVGGGAEDRRVRAQVADRGQVRGVRVRVADQGRGLEPFRAAGGGHRYREAQRGQPQRRQRDRRRRVGPPGLVAYRRALRRPGPGPGRPGQRDDLLVLGIKRRFAHPDECSEGGGAKTRARSG